MKKRVAASVKRSAAKPIRTLPVRNKKKMSAKKPPAPQAKPAFKEDPSFAQAVQNYETALKAMQERKFDRAKGLLEKVISNGPRELADRARVYLSSCNQQLNEGSANFKTHEEHFDYAVSLLNTGQFDQARTHLEKFLSRIRRLTSRFTEWP